MLPLILGAGALAGAMVLLVWTLAGSRSAPAAAAASRNLTAGMLPSADLREAVLAVSATERVVQPGVAWLARVVRRFTPIGRLEQLEHRMLVAGVGRMWTLERVLAAKLALAAVGAAVGVFRVVQVPGLPSLLMAGAAVAVLFMAPDLVLIDKAQKRREAVRRALPDTLDQLAITVEAGLAFESAVARAARSTKGPLADELLRMLQDVQAGMTRREALRGLSDRVDAPELRSFVTAVLQAERYGVPIGQTLRVQSGELRLKRTQRAEEKAAKLPVKLLFPMVLLIFPVLFIVLLGPAMLQIGRTL